MRSRNDGIDVAATQARAFAIGVVGFGDAPGDLRVDRRVARFADVADGSFAWTRDVDGFYRLCRIRGPYRQDESADAVLVDLVHVRPCEWLATPLTESAVPPTVAATFGRGGRNFQQTHSPTVGFETERIWLDAPEWPVDARISGNRVT